MITAKDLAGMAQIIAADAVRQASDWVLNGRDQDEATPDEAGAILNITIMVAGALEAHAVASLPEHLARNVRAAIARFSDRVQKLLNSEKTLLTPTDGDGIVGTEDSTSTPNS